MASSRQDIPQMLYIAQLYVFACVWLFSLAPLFSANFHINAGGQKNIFAIIELLTASSTLTQRPILHTLLPAADITFPLIPIIESLSMTRPLLSVLGAALLCAQSINCLADNTSTVAATSGQPVREAFEEKRDQASGVSKVSQATSGPAAVLDTPIATDDAPAQAQQP
ncbi:hypothetical protein [Pseudomonas japonica]|uniref:hypothetical protein n=1 Tax=Pseudomonas japonica TaxID=256466 RepID=UPI0021592C2A